MFFNCSAVNLPAPGISLSITYLGIVFRFWILKSGSVPIRFLKWSLLPFLLINNTKVNKNILQLLQTTHYHLVKII